MWIFGKVAAAGLFCAHSVPRNNIVLAATLAAVFRNVRRRLLCMRGTIAANQAEVGKVMARQQMAPNPTILAPTAFWETETPSS